MSKIATTFLLSVAPISRIPLSRDQSFFYTATSSLPIGTLVEIPIGKRTVRGVVTAAHEDFERSGGITLKPVGAVLEAGFVTEKQLALAQMISTHYYASLGIVLKHTVPDRVSQKKKPEPTPLTTISPIILSDRTQKICEKILSEVERAQPLYVQSTYSTELPNALVHVIQETLLRTSGQILVLVPERTQIPQYVNLLTQTFPEEIIAQISSTMTKGTLFANWERIRGATEDEENHAQIIIGTRGAIYAPFDDLSLVVTMDAHDTTYKQWEMNPRYDARTCAQFLARIHACAHLRISATPLIARDDDETSTYALPQGRKPRTTLIDMKIEYNDVNEKKFQKKHPVISRALKLELTKVLERGEQALLFINRQGKNAFSVCEKCKTVARCPTCERALVESSRGNHRCLHCSFKTAVFPACTNCRSLNFRTVGMGTETVEEEVQKLFPRARIARVDGETMKKASSYGKLYQKSINKKIDIVIGTQMAMKGWSLPGLRVAAIIDMDTLLGSYDYDAHEKAFAHILGLSSRLSASDVPSTELFIQSYDTLHEVIIGAIDKNPLKAWGEFCDGEKGMREILHFPPYARLIKLTYNTPDKRTLEKLPSVLYDELIEACKDESSIIISEPHDPLVPKVRTNYKKQIIIKVSSAGTIPTSLHNTLLALDTHWTIDIDPTNIT